MRSEYKAIYFKGHRIPEYLGECPTLINNVENTRAVESESPAVIKLVNSGEKLLWLDSAMRGAGRLQKPV